MYLQKPSSRALYLACLWIGWIAFFLLMKVVFLLRYAADFSGYSWGELFNVFIRGWILDASVAAYLCIPVLLRLTLFPTISPKAADITARGYFLLFGLIVSVIFASDLELYKHWGFRLDTTPLFYLRHPEGALAGGGLWEMVMFFIQVPIYFSLIYWGGMRLRRLTLPNLTGGRKRIFLRSFLLLLGGTPLLLLSMRGGLSVAPVNPGAVCFSRHKALNEASTNPVFSLAYSLTHSENFAETYRYFNEDERARIFAHIFAPRQSDCGSAAAAPEVLSRDSLPRNIIVVLMESFSANAMGAYGANLSATPCLDRLADSSLFFSRCYASSFRTDRGLPAILSGFPAQPTTSILKHPQKLTNLPSLARTLGQVGYGSYFLYGGDADFANLRGYLSATGYDRITDYEHFPTSLKKSKWGVADAYTFDYLLQEYKRLDARGKPFFYTFLTLSSHEPFDVPTRRFESPYLNSLAYTDSCAGKFIEELKKTDGWKHTLVVFVSDHGYPYPSDMEAYDPRRFAMLMMWTGGALRQNMRVEEVNSELDLPATLLSRMGIRHDAFTYSVDVLDPNVDHFAFYSFPDLFGWVDAGGYTVFDNTSRKVLMNKGSETERHVRAGKAYLQTLYNDIARR